MEGYRQATLRMAAKHMQPLPTEQSCQFPGLETKCRSMGHCDPAITHLMTRKK